MLHNVGRNSPELGGLTSTMEETRSVAARRALLAGAYYILFAYPHIAFRDCMGYGHLGNCTTLSLRLGIGRSEVVST